jgi:hypothetical protein
MVRFVEAVATNGGFQELCDVVLLLVVCTWLQRMAASQTLFVVSSVIGVDIVSSGRAATRD